MKGLSRKSWNLIAARLPHLLVAIAAVGGILLGQSTRKPSQIGCASSPGRGIANDPWTIGTGPENAPLTVIIFSDFQSFLCGRTAHVLVDTLGESKDIRLIFKHLPKNDEALLAHEAAIAAGAQGKFWEMHNMLFENQSHLSRADLSNYSRQLGLNVATFNAALDQHTYRNMIAHDLADAKALGVVTAPTFFINGRRLVGPPTPAALKAVLDSVVTGLPSRTSDQDTSPGPAVAIALKHAPARGPASAPVSIVEFSDFECPFCAESVAILRAVLTEYPTQVRLSFKHFPLPSHPLSPLVHEAVMASGEQGKFWEMHDLVFATQDKLTRDDLIRKAGS